MTLLTVSPDKTLITAPTAIVDSSGNVWTIVNGQVSLNNVLDPTTRDVTSLALVGANLWQSSTALGGVKWWSKDTKTAATAPWLPNGGTTANPLTPPVTTPTPPVTTPPVTTPPVTTPPVTTPPVSPGTGIQIKNGQFYDSNGNLFYPQGINELHFDDSSANSPASGLPISGANIVRYWFDGQGYPMASHVKNIQNYLSAKIVVMGCQSYFSNGAQTTGSSTPLNDIINWWVNNSATLAPLLNKHGMVNVANEWGLSDSAAWATGCEEAITALRNAPTPYTCPLIFDSGGYGQDTGDLLNFSTAVASSDPLKNTGFSFHLYGNTSSVQAMNSFFASLKALSAKNGAAYIIGEFGPGKNIGPSPTLITPDQVIAAARLNGLGWIAWAWDDNDLGGGASDDNSFSMTRQGPGYYTGQASQLTQYGQDIVAQLQNNPKATDF